MQSVDEDEFQLTDFPFLVFIRSNLTCVAVNIYSPRISPPASATNIYKPHDAQESQRQTKRAEINLRLTEALLMAVERAAYLATIFNHYQQ